MAVSAAPSEQVRQRITIRIDYDHVPEWRGRDAQRRQGCASEEQTC
jgi:hypothetical protein